MGSYSKIAPPQESHSESTAYQLSDTYSVAHDVKLALSLGSLGLSRIFLFILLVSDRVQPGRLPTADCQVRHDAALIGPMPVSRPWRCPNDIPYSQPLWLPAFVADPSRTDFDLQNLPILVVVPVRACTGRESDVGDDNALL